MGALTLSLRTEKVAGSNPAERATESPAKRRYQRGPGGKPEPLDTNRAYSSTSSIPPVALPVLGRTSQYTLQGFILKGLGLSHLGLSLLLPHGRLEISPQPVERTEDTTVEEVS